MSEESGLTVPGEEEARNKRKRGTDTGVRGGGERWVTLIKKGNNNGF